MIRIATVSLGLAAGLAALSAAPAAAQQTTASNDEAGDPNPVSTIVCRRYPPPTGTRIGPRRICKTQHEWDLIDEEIRSVVENIGTRSYVGNE